MIALIRNTKKLPTYENIKIASSVNSNKKPVSFSIYKIILFSFAGVPIIMKCEETNKKS